MPIKNIVILLLVLALSYGCSAKDPQEELKKRGYSYTEESFVRAVRSGDLEVAKLYLDAGMKADSGEASDPYRGTSRRTVLHVAAESGQPEIAKLLIDNGANVNARDNRGRQPLLSASLAGSKEIVELLVSHGAEINPTEKEPPSTPLLTAIGRGHYEVAKYLISKGADVLVISQSGYTALHAASASGNPQVVELVISSNIDVNAKAKDGVTPLRLAAQANDITDIAASLINHGADVNIPDQDGRTALNWAVTMHHTKTVELLLQHGADVNIVDNLGMTALHWAILRDGNSEHKQLASYKTVQLLLSKGARIDVVDKQGRTPSTIAKRKEIVSLLHMASSGDRAREAIALIEPNDTRKHVATIGDKKIFLDEVKPRASSTDDVRRFNDEQKLLLIRVIWSPLRDVYIHENQIQSTDNEAVDFLAELERPDQSQLIKQEEVINDIKRRLAGPNNQPAIIKKLNEELLRGEYQLTRYMQLMLFSHNQMKKEMGQLTNFHLQIGHKMVRNWKFDKSVYERYGGKIYFSKFKAVGEPLDSYKKFIGEMERRGIIKFYDETIKKAVYHYLTTPDDTLKTLTEIYYSKPNWYWMELYKGQ
jgi:ankyrin repeat protein